MYLLLPVEKEANMDRCSDVKVTIPFDGAEEDDGGENGSTCPNEPWPRLAGGGGGGGGPKPRCCADKSPTGSR